MKISKGTIIRTILLAIAFLNHWLTAKGYNPLPWSETEIYDTCTWLLDGIAVVWAWWKNNSFTKAAIKGDEIMHDIKKGGI